MSFSLGLPKKGGAVSQAPQQQSDQKGQAASRPSLPASAFGEDSSEEEEEAAHPAAKARSAGLSLPTPASLRGGISFKFGSTK